MKLLIVDDEAHMRDLLREFIIDSGLHAEDDIFVASNGVEGLELFKKELPKIVITDMMMPKMNGAQMAEGIRAIDPEVELVVSTAHADIDMALTVIKVGASALLRKPFESKELILCLEKIHEKFKLLEENLLYRQSLAQAEKLSSIGLMAAGVAHELNNPNTFVKGNLEILKKFFNIIRPTLEAGIAQKGPDAEKLALVLSECEQTIEGALNGSMRMTKIVNGLLSFGRARQEGKAPIDIKQLVDEALILVAHRIKTHEIKVEIAPETQPIEVNSQDIVQVIMNFTVNACDAIESKFKGERGKLTILVGPKENSNTQIIQFQDNGIGMNEKVLGKIFTPFFTTKPIGKGTGLGLSLAKQAVEKNGGTLECHSKEGEGTEFILSFPKAA